jgi:hypothetical protein
MEPLIARGFVTLMLAKNQVTWLKEHERSLPPGRYLQAFEVLRLAGVSGGEIAPEREARMKSLLEIWEKENWKKNQLEDKAHEKTCHGERKHVSADDALGWCKCRTYQQEIHEWMDYVDKYWREPLPKPGSGKLTQKINFQAPESGRTSKPAKKAAAELSLSDMGDLSDLPEGME